MSRWIYLRDGEQFGPTDLGGLRQLAKSMHLLPDSKVWRPGQNEGVLASTLEGLQFPTPEAQSDGERRTGQGIDMDHKYHAEQGRLLALYVVCGTVILIVLVLFTSIMGSMV
jgi:hypothetical protein